MNSKQDAITFYENNRGKSEISRYDLTIWDRKAKTTRFLKPFAIIRLGENLVPVFADVDNGMKFISRLCLERVIRKKIVPAKGCSFYNLIDSVELLCSSKEVNPGGIAEFISFIHELYLLGNEVYLIYGVDFQDSHVDVMQELDTWSKATGFSHQDVIGMLEISYGEDVVREAFMNDGSPYPSIPHKYCPYNIGKVGQLTNWLDRQKLFGDTGL
jgi:hypothetical protein